MSSNRVSFQLPSIGPGRSAKQGRPARPSTSSPYHSQLANSYELQVLPERIHVVADPVPHPMISSKPPSPSRFSTIRSYLRGNYLRNSMAYHAPIAMLLWHFTAFPPVLIGEGIDGRVVREQAQEYGRVYAAIVGGVMIDFPFMAAFAFIRSQQMLAQMGNINSSMLAFVQLVVPYTLLSYPIGTAILKSTQKDWGVHSMTAALFSSLTVALLILVCLYFFVIQGHYSARLEGGKETMKNRIEGPMDFLTFGPLGRFAKMDKEYVPGQNKKGKRRAIGDLESQQVTTAAAMTRIGL